MHVCERGVIELPAQLFGADLQLRAHDLDQDTASMERTAHLCVCHGMAIWRRMEGDDAILREEAAISHIEIALGRLPFCQKNIVAIEFDVPVGNRLNVLLRDGRAIHERNGGNQHFTQHVEANGMTGRYGQVSQRPAFAECSSGNADWLDAVRFGMSAAIDHAMANPADRAMRTGCRNGEVANPEIFNCYIDPGPVHEGTDCRAGDIAWGGYGIENQITGFDAANIIAPTAGLDIIGLSGYRIEIYGRIKERNVVWVPPLLLSSFDPISARLL